MSAPPLSGELQRELEQVAAEEGCELVHAEFQGGTLRLVIDHQDGVTLEHCSSVSRQASSILDVEDYGGGRYVLEVSSPGLDRQLYRPLDYERFCGSKVRVRFMDPGTRKRRTVIGVLESFRGDDGGEVIISADGDTIELPLADIEKANLEVEF